MCTWNVSMFRVLISAAALLISEGLLVQGPAQPLVAQLGGSIILPCSVETPLPVEELEVEWKRTDEEALVHLFQDGQDRPEAQYQSYKDRAHFFSEQIFKGNFSILLENITVADTGLYRCVVYSYQDVGEISVTIQHVERVVVTGKDQIILARVGEDVVLNCMVDSHIPPQRFDEVSWKKVDKSPDIIPVLLFQNGTIFSGSSHKRYIDRAEFFREEIPKGNFSIRLKNVQTSDKGEYMCEVHTEKSVNSATVEIQRLDTGTKPMYINYLQVVCPNICLSIAFVLWGVIEGSVVEVTMCATINLSRIILLFLMAPYFNWNTTVSVDLPVSFHRIIEYMGIPIAYLLISTAFCSAVLHDLWNASKWSEVVLVSALIILLSSTPVFLRALSEVCFTHFFEIHFSLRFVTKYIGHILMQTSNFFEMRLLFFRSSSVNESMIIMAYAIGGISAVVSFIVLPIPAVRHYFCLKLPKHQLHTLIWRCYLVWANIMLVTLIGHSAFILYYLNKILEYTNERFGWIFVTVLLHVLTATVSERFSRTLPDAVYNTLFMFGVAGLPVINSVSLATELILQVYKGERTVDDLRVLVLPFESIMAGVWLILQICEYWVTKWRDVGKELYVLRDFVAQFISQQGDTDESDNLSEICLSEIQRCQPEAAPFLEERELRRFKMS
uniref:Ig-like domain-containing protein n=1 Tax=Cyprinus carpio TaxID=7962 RepID=A0A8C1SE65_CYPCA